MSGPFGSQQWMYASGGFYPHEIDNSARLDTNSYFQRTPSSSGNRKTWTWSGWVKRGELGASGSQTFFQQRADSSSSQQFSIKFRSSDTIRVIEQTSGGGTTYLLDTNAALRDPSAWYHIVVAYDTTNATAGDRVKLYVNGERQTSFSTANTWPLNNDSSVNTTARALIGANRPNTSSTLSQYYNGYLAEVNFVDGQALDPTAFGKTKSGVWIPNGYSGTYGTNGFYLNFATRATDPIDASGNGNNWGSVNVVSTDWMLDSPTNNFATLNPLAQFGSPPISEGNLKVELANGSDGVFASIQPTGDKYYWEALLSSGIQGYGVMANTGNASSSTNTLYFTDGRIYVANSLVTSSATTATSGNIIGIAYDPTAETIKFFKNNSQIGGTYSATGDGLLPITTGTGNGTGVSVINFGQDSSFAGNKTAQGNTDANGRGDFYYTPPSGYLALCTANLPDPVIDPSKDNVPADYFNTVLWTGDGTDNRAITGVGFQPDLTWVKGRSAAEWHTLFDVLRGANKSLYPNDDYQEETTSELFESFDSDGFTVGYNSNYSSVFTNKSSTTYVAWNWKAGGSGVSNSDGTTASVVSANTDTGFSIVTYTGTGSAGMTIGHGLSSAPKLIIVKNRADSLENWTIYFTPIGNDKKLELNTDIGAATTGNWNNTNAGSSVFTLGSVDATNTSGESCVAYCFHEVEGFSKIGLFDGNGSADGPFINTGFRPAFVLLKNADSAEWWTLIDNKRLGYNEVNSILSPNASNAEYAASGGGVDLLSNGFKVRGTSSNFNANTANILYMAFAEMPFKYANAR